MRALRSWLFAAVCLALAWSVSLIVPSEVAWRDGYPVAATIGEQLTDGRLKITIHDVVLTDDLVEESFAGVTTLTSTWVVVDLSAQLVNDESDAVIDRFGLVIDGKTYVVSDRPMRSTLLDALSIAVPTRDYVAFEIPAELADHEATLQISLDNDIDDANTYFTVPISLSALDRESTVSLPHPEAGA